MEFNELERWCSNTQFGDVALNACKEDLLQLFVEKGALTPVKWEDLNDEQRKNAVRLHMFLKEKHEDGKFIKMKARLVEDGRMQDREVYNDYSSPTAKTRSVMTFKISGCKKLGPSQARCRGCVSMCSY